jgi:hypothetical protein
MATILKVNRIDVNGKEPEKVHAGEVSDGLGSPCRDLMKARLVAEEYLHRHRNA